MLDENGQEIWIQLTPYAIKTLTKRTYAHKLSWVSMPLDLMNSPVMNEFGMKHQLVFLTIILTAIGQNEAKLRLKQATFGPKLGRVRAKDVQSVTNRAEQYQWFNRYFWPKPSFTVAHTLHNITDITERSGDFSNQLGPEEKEIRKKLLKSFAKSEDE